MINTTSRRYLTTRSRVFVLSNDILPFILISLRILDPPTNGMAFVDASLSSSIIYQTASTVSVSMDKFSYEVCDIRESCSIAFVTIELITTHSPVASDDTVSTFEDADVRIFVLANDRDADGDIMPASLLLLSPPSHGTISISELGYFVYRSDDGYVGPDGCTYSIADRAGFTSQASISLTILRIASPILKPDLATTAFESQVLITLLDNDDPLQSPFETKTFSTPITSSNGGTIRIVTAGGCGVHCSSWIQWCR
jgi:large repetitive protein